MKYLVTGKEMKLLDENTSEHFGLPSETLMEQAADAFVQKLFLLKPEMKSVLVVCGSGNNGGDGVAIARLLNQRGISASVYLCFSNHQGLLKKQLDIYEAYQYPVVGSLDNINSFDVVCDAIFGTGLSRNIEGALSEVISVMNDSTCFKVAVDISSGISSEDGKVLGSAFRADETITFSFAKIGHVLYPGAEYSGNLSVEPIGITMESSLGRTIRTKHLDQEDMCLLPKRTSDSNKGTYGKLLIIAGSKNMAGAAYLSAKAAYRLGCGLVKIVTCEENRQILQTLIPEAILETYDKGIKEDFVLSQLKWADSVLIGPGLGTGENAEKLLDFTLKNVTVPLIMDADALNITAKNPDYLLRPHFDIIITPHVGEMARLTGEPITYVQNHFMETAREYADKYNVICHLKDSRSLTVIPYGDQWIQLKGNDGMSTAGSGDVLAGIIASLSAQGLTSDVAAYLGAYIHGDCGDCAAERVGRRALMASDLIDSLTQLAYLR